MNESVRLRAAEHCVHTYTHTGQLPHSGTPVYIYVSPSRGPIVNWRIFDARGQMLGTGQRSTGSLHPSDSEWVTAYMHVMVDLNLFCLRPAADSEPN
jgi:hypothetical protein